MTDQAATDQQIVIKALGELQGLLTSYIRLGHRDPASTIAELLRMIDDEELVAAMRRIAAERDKSTRH
jgi:hypothetical protein